MIQIRREFCFSSILQLHIQLSPGGTIFFPEGNSSWFQREVVLTKFINGSGYHRKTFEHYNHPVDLGNRDEQLYNEMMKNLHSTTMDPTVWTDPDKVKFWFTCDNFKK